MKKEITAYVKATGALLRAFEARLDELSPQATPTPREVRDDSQDTPQPKAVATVTVVPDPAPEVAVEEVQAVPKPDEAVPVPAEDSAAPEPSPNRLFEVVGSEEKQMWGVKLLADGDYLRDPDNDSAAYVAKTYQEAFDYASTALAGDARKAPAAPAEEAPAVSAETKAAVASAPVGGKEYKVVKSRSLGKWGVKIISSEDGAISYHKQEDGTIAMYDTESGANDVRDQIAGG